MSLMPRFICFAVLMVIGMPAWSASAVLKSADITAGHGVTRVAFHLSARPSFHDFALGKPPRAVLDMHHTRNAWSAHALAGGAVRHIRLARHHDGTLRAVLDLRPGAHLAGLTRKGDALVMRITGGNTSAHPKGSDSRATAHSAPALKHAGKSAARRAPRSRRTSYRAAPQTGPIVVVIDPGHGGRDPGTRGPHGLREKTVTLAIARRVYHKLAQTPHVHPVLTRNRDRYVSLPKRVSIAQKHHADLFVSIHENAFPDNPAVNGGTCYVLSRYGASNAEAAQLAHFENSADPEVAGVHFSAHNHTLNTILTQLFQNDSIGAADELAKSIISRFSQVEPLYHRKPRRANFAVLRDPMIPSVLCETAFLSNPAEARALHGAHFRDQIANAIYEGVMHYLRNNPPMRALPNRRDVYIVKRGDTLSGIAQAHHIPAQRLMAINDLRRRSLNPGQRLIVPHDRGASTAASGGPSDTGRRTVRYRVHSGDTLSAIADRHHLSLHALMAMNHLHAPGLRAGQTLKVPAPPAADSADAAPSTYTVHSGDTLSQIAAQYGVSTQRLEQLNDLSGGQIRTGQVLHLPADASSSS